LSEKGKVLECEARLLAERCVLLSRRDKKAQGLEQHKKLQREKEEKRKLKRQVALPAKHKK
jgi:hypothetical protein